jgi:ABC-type Mn2+/Zn2+ transport system permease subunit
MGDTISHHPQVPFLAFSHHLRFLFLHSMISIRFFSLIFSSASRYSPTKTKVGQKWYQLLALSYCLATGILIFVLNGHFSIKSIIPVSALNEHKN